MSADAVSSFLKKDFQTLVDSMLDDMRRPGPGRVALTDATEGSVVRTLVEAFSRELALCYEQLERVYKMGYLDTATGPALDQVVALIGVQRRPAGWLEGLAIFSRSTAAAADTPIPAGTLVGGKNVPLCETAESATLLAGHLEVTVKVRSVEAPKPDVQKGEAGALRFMPRPINGIEAVRNDKELMLGVQGETDDELRQRARQFVSGSNLGTLAALRVAAARLGFSEVKFEELPQHPGVVKVLVDGLPPEKEEELKGALDEARPAGVQVTLQRTDSLYVDVQATLYLDGEYAAADKQAIVDQALKGLSAYFASLKIGEPVRWSKISSILSAHPAVVGVEAPKDASDPSADGAKRSAPLRPFLLDASGGKQSQLATLVHTGGWDVNTKARQRACFDGTVAQATLLLLPQSLEVLVDAELTLQNKEPDADKARARQELLEQNLREYLARRQKSFTLKDVLLATLRIQDNVQTRDDLQLTIIHRHDGRVVELHNPADEDYLDDREVIKLRDFEVR